MISYKEFHFVYNKFKSYFRLNNLMFFIFLTETDIHHKKYFFNCQLSKFLINENLMTT